MMMRKRRTNEAQPDNFTLNQALDYCREHTMMLVHSENSRGDLVIEVWSGTLKVPIGIRRTIYACSEQLLRMMIAGDVNVCTDPAAHARKWRKAKNGSQWCAICKQLESAMQSETIPIAC